MRLFSIKPTLTIKGRKFKGIRGWSGKPTHPPLTDIPIGAYVLAAAFDLLSVLFGEGETGHNLFVASSYVLLGGLIVSVPTALTGLFDWWKSTPKGTQAWRTANTHMAIMLTTTALVVLDLLLRWGDLDTAAVTPTGTMILTVIIGGAVGLGATFGGTLVYDYEFNVEQDRGYAWEESETDYLPGEKPETKGTHA
jgi:uncharacterized membrane protein